MNERRTPTPATAGSGQAPPGPITALLARTRATPDRAALIVDDRVWTYGQVVELSRRLATGLSARGVGAGDRVCLHLHNRLETALSYLACLRLGAIAVPLNARLTPPELLDLVQRTRPIAYIGESALYPRFAPTPEDLVSGDARFLIEESTWVDLLEVDLLVADDPDGDPTSGAVAGAPESPAILLSTSGTTSRPKIVAWSHRTLANLHLSADGRGIVDGAVLPLITPLMHGAAVYFLINALTQGGVALLVRRFDPAEVLEAMHRHRATTLFGLPFMCDALVQEQRRRPRDIDTLRSAVVAGDVCPVEVELGFQHTFGIPLRSFWAAAEDVGCTVAGSGTGPFMRVIDEASVRIQDAEGRAVHGDEPGELVVSSPTTSPGYWDDDGHITPFPKGVFHSGDLVREVSPGLLRFVGRRNDLIIRGGSNISPTEVEDALRTEPEVADAAVAGLPTERLGQRVGAVLVLISGPHPDDVVRRVIASVSKRLAGYKVPECVAVVDSVPRNALTKIDRAAVVAKLSSSDTQKHATEPDQH
ncbi:MAG TPA: class I adenylate-forming enzyme family protein [Pseudonocardiaceae bacterium]